MKRSYEKPVLTKQKPLADVTAQPYLLYLTLYGAPPGGDGEVMRLVDLWLLHKSP